MKAKKYLPLRRYFNNVDAPAKSRFHWDIFPLQLFRQCAPTSPQMGLTVFSHFRIHERGVTFTMHIPLPEWTHQFMARLEALPYYTPITREHMCTILRAPM